MMNRRDVIRCLGVTATLPWFSACARADAPSDAAALASAGRAALPTGYWRDKVSPAAYKVLFESDTERSGSSPLNVEHRKGTFVCAACYQPLFASEHKFESGTGWPSFTQGIPGRTSTKRDFVMLIPRTEYHCARCGGHQGHIFKDGPPPLGTRWCNNGLALRFVPEGESLPTLRGAA